MGRGGVRVRVELLQTQLVKKGRGSRECMGVTRRPLVPEFPRRKFQIQAFGGMTPGHVSRSEATCHSTRGSTLAKGSCVLNTAHRREDREIAKIGTWREGTAPIQDFDETLHLGGIGWG